MSGRLRTKFGRQPSKTDAHAEVVRWLEHLEVQIPKPPPIALRWSDMAEIPVAEATDDDLVIHPDHATLDDLAHAVVSITRDCDETFPGPWSWRRWKRLHKLAVWFDRWSPFTVNGSSSTTGRDPSSSWVFSYRWPRWSTFYVLGKPEWWWACQRRQGWTLRRHTPAQPFVLGICARCVPCPECGAPYDCADDCPTLTPTPTEEAR